MEVTRGYTHSAFPMDDPSRIGEARRHAAQLAASLDFGEVQAGRLALVVSELATNLQRHATGGQLLLAARSDSADVEVLCIDRGPGIADVERCLSDGFSTGGTPGTGLGAVRRLADAFDLHSSVPQGTVLVARVGRQPLADTSRARQAAPPAFAALCLPAPGQTECGDSWAIAQDSGRIALLVADGLGHGPQARTASQAALDVFVPEPFGDMTRLLQDIHGELRTTRGAAGCLLRLDQDAGSIRYGGAGNVMGRVVSGVVNRTLLTQHGTLGVQVRRPEETAADWSPHALVVVHTDGLESRWTPAALLPLLDRDPALAAAVLWRDHCRGRDDVTVVVMRRTP